jgi:hypothetical protein
MSLITTWRQEAYAMQLLEPPAVARVALPARDVPDVKGIDEQDLQAAGLQDLVDRDPVDARGLHGDGLDAAIDQPAGQSVQPVGEGLGLDTIS